MTLGRPATGGWAPEPPGARVLAPMARPIVLGVVGDSGAGKTTLTRGLVRVLGDGNVAHLSADDYHRYDRREFLAPPEELRRAWKLKRDCTRRGYTTDQVLWELDHRERDAEAFIRPQQAHADIVVSFRPHRGGDPAHLEAEVVLRDTLPHPDLEPLVGDTDDGPELARGEGELLLRIPGDIDPDHAAVLEEAVWERMSFASHLRVRRLGEFTVGTDLLRSDSLALVQVILLYHMVCARAALAVGGSHGRREPAPATGADSALHT